MNLRPKYFSPEESVAASTETTPETIEETPSEELNVFDEMASIDEDTEDTEAPEAPAAETTPAEAKEGEVTPEPEAETTPATSAEQSEGAPLDISKLTPEQLQQIQQQMSQQPATPSEEETRAANLEQYNADVKNLTEFYTLNEDERAQLESDPAEALPVLAAKMHYQVVNAVTQGVMQAMPRVVGGVIQQHQQNTDLQDKFFQAWPQLDATKHMSDVMRMGQLYRQANPNASFETFINDVGSQVMVQHRLTATAPPPASVSEPIVPPDTPSGVNTPAAASAPVSAGNMWEEFSAEIDED